MTFEQLYNAIKAYADEHNLTPAQLAAATQRQVATALSLSAADKILLGRCWDSLRGRVKQAWLEEEEEGKFQAFLADVQAKILLRFPTATFSREGSRYIVDVGGA